MGLLTNILLSPFLGPIWGTKWTLDKVDRVVREQLTDDTPIKEDLMTLQMQLETGEIDDPEYVRREAEIMQRLLAAPGRGRREAGTSGGLCAVREGGEQLGIAPGGGPVRVPARAERE